ncbi:MAG: hypothetical protein ACYSXF_08315, partial [Planctomycetota bacterium]
MAGFTMVVSILVASAAAALLLRWARLPGWPVAGGVLAGLILGPTILGRVLPQGYESLFVGGAEERRTLDLHELLAAEAEATGGDASDSVAEAREALREARHRHQKPLRDLAALAAALVLAGGGARRGQKPSAGTVSILSIGAWSAAVPGALALAAARWLWSWEWPESMLVAAAVAIGPWRLGHSDREAAEGAEVEGGRLIEAAGRVASAIALVACVWALRAGGGYPAMGVGWPLLGVLVSWMFPIGGGRWVGVGLRVLLVPALAASVAI